eukprot:PITA_09040
MEASRVKQINGQPSTKAPRYNYKDALSKSILFYEGQRSGKLPADQRMTWRRDSALKDGSLANVDLAGGYYDAGDNVKYGFPMAYTATMLSWSVIEFGNLMDKELTHALTAIRWATDYILKTVVYPDTIYVQVGDPNSDHHCWERPEDMDTPRTVYKINKENPGSEVAAEKAAALAAASIVFQKSDLRYSRRLLNTALWVFDFADKYRGAYSDNPSLRSGVCPFYCSYSGYEYFLHEKVTALGGYKENADYFICSLLPESPYSLKQFTPGGLIFKDPGGNMQRVTAFSFLLLTYASYLNDAKQTVACGSTIIRPDRLRQFAKRQVDYILGDNPLELSYMVGYGPRYPQRIHHRAASLASVAVHPAPIKCDGGAKLFAASDPNPNVLVGAITGGPDANDQYADSRALPAQSEPTTYYNAPLVGALAFFSGNPDV